MADLVPITLTEGNDETILVTINRMYLADDLLTITSIEFYLKDSDCVDDAGALLLSSTDAGQVLILTQTSAQITAHVFVPASSLRGSYARFYRVDGLIGVRRRTAVYGTVTMNDV
jgi:hypothetical protein